MESKRKYYLDNIRTIVILVLFLAHTCEIFHMKEGFYVEGNNVLVPTLIYNFFRSWLMGVLFLIAGLTTMYSLKKRTIKEYYKERCKRLLLPFAIGLFLWIPIQSYWALKNHYDFEGSVLDVYKHFFTTYTDGLYGYDGGFTPSHLWFLIYLMVIALICYPVIKYKQKKDDKPILEVSGKWFLLFTLLIYVISYGTSDESIGKFIAFFVVGVLLYNNQSLFDFALKRWKALCVFAIVENVAMAYLLISMHDMNIWSLDYMWMRLIWAFSCTTAVFATIGVGQVCLNKTNAVFRYLSSRSFAVYYIHMTVLITVGYYVVTYMACGVFAQVCVIMAVSAVITFALVEVAARVPGVNWLLGLK